MDTQAVIDQFNVCLKMEYAAVVQYHQHSYLLRGLDRVQYLEFFEEAGQEALGHAKLLGSKIVSLGGVPTVERGEAHVSRRPRRSIASAFSQRLSSFTPGTSRSTSIEW